MCRAVGGKFCGDPCPVSFDVRCPAQVTPIVRRLSAHVLRLQGNMQESEYGPVIIRVRPPAGPAPTRGGVGEAEKRGQRYQIWRLPPRDASSLPELEDSLEAQLVYCASRLPMVSYGCEAAPLGLVRRSGRLRQRSRAYDDPKRRAQEIPMRLFEFTDTRHADKKGRGRLWALLPMQLPRISRSRVYLLERGLWSPLRSALVIQGGQSSPTTTKC
jgi:hypothetical protein